MKSNIVTRHCFEFIDVSIAEFDLTIEENFLFDFFDFFSALRLRRGLKFGKSTGGAPKSMNSMASSGQINSFHDWEAVESS